MVLHGQQFLLVKKIIIKTYKMKKNSLYILLLASLSLTKISAQVYTNELVKNNVAGSNAFFDASTNFNFSASSSHSIGKGLVFPDTDLTQFKFDMNLADGVTFPSYFDGMLVYNTGTGATSDPLLTTQTTGLVPGWYYFFNPNGTATGSVAAGKWLPVSKTLTEIDGIIGNEVTNATVSGALVRAGSGTAADPFTLGIPDQGITTAKIADENVTYAKIKTPVRIISSNYTLGADDEGGFIYVDSPSPITITVPGSLLGGFHCVIVQSGAGQVTVVGTGVTMTSARGTKTRTQYSAVGVIKPSLTQGTITGDAIN
jgi:hypothetical protein